jgi:lipopolysaccharide transport system ATP-binding protein
MSPAIRVENLGKKYRIGQAGTRGGYRTLREGMTDSAKSCLGRLRAGTVRTKTDEFWALRALDFEVQAGEVVGIIGRNGAGKSTLLKILSRITKPTTGLAELRGRVGSLLEVGTGFHPELTGRENVYLNGSILGMSRREIGHKFDEIVAFAEIEKFLDTPVKRYSSGMYVRLAFSVAAHLEPEILLVDEVLAVGDASYQRRCIDRMSELARSGRSILFVSHNLDLIPRLCQRAVQLERGQITAAGAAGAVVRTYLEAMIGAASTDDLTQRPRTGNGLARFTRLTLLDSSGCPVAQHKSGEDLVLLAEIRAERDVKEAELAVVLQHIGGARIASSWTRESGFAVALNRGTQTFRCRLRKVRLRPGHRVTVGLWMADTDVLDHVEEARVVEVIDGSGTQQLSNDRHQGLVIFDSDWTQTGRTCLVN